MTYRRGPEYQPNLRLGTRFAVIGGLAFTAACRAEIQSTPTPEIFPTQSRANEVIPKTTETLYVGVGMGQGEIIREVNGRTPPGAGGLISTENIDTVGLDNRIHSALLKVSLAPVHENRVISRVVNRPDGVKECYPIMPDVLFNPYLPEGVEERDDWLNANNTVVSYGDSLTNEVRFKGLRTLSLGPTSKDVFCVSAIVNSDDNPFRDESGRPVNDGVVLNVLMDREGNIYGTLPGIYGANDTVVFNAVDNKVYVNGDEVWHVGDRMAELASSLASKPLPTETPEAGLTEEKIQQLAAELECLADRCVRREAGPRGLSAYYFGVDAIFSGKIQEVQIVEPKTGEVIANADVAVGITKDIDGNPRMFRMVVQASALDNPDVVILDLANVVNFLLGNQWEEGANPRSKEELQEIFHEGLQLNFIVPASLRYFEGGQHYKELLQILYNDAEYTSKLQEFENKEGAVQLEEDFYFFAEGLSLILK